MKILSSEDKLNSQYIIPFIDTSKHLIINTVPYVKETKTPVPFRNIVSKMCDRTLYGKKSFQPYDEKQFYSSSNTAGFYTDSYYANYYANYNSQEAIVDNNDSNITYVIEIKNYPTSATHRNMIIKKITSTNDNILVTDYNLGGDYAYTNMKCSYLTQNDNYIFALIDRYYGGLGSYYSSSIHSIMYKINKSTFAVEKCYCSAPGGYTSSYRDGSSDTNYNNAGFCKVLKEMDDGLILYSMSIFSSNSSTSGPTNSYNYSNPYVSVDYRFYSFDTNRMTRISYTLDSNCPTPPYNSTIFNNSYSSFNTTSIKLNKICLPSKCLETETKYYFYVYSHSSSNLDYSVGPNTLYYFELNKSDITTSTIYKVNLVFPEGSDISQLPTIDSGSYSSIGVQVLNSCRYETQVFNIGGTDYVNIWWEGMNYYPQNSRGVYTFKVNQDKTEATYLGSYKAVGGMLHGYMPLNNDETKILISTPTSYHIAIFDSEAEEWKITYESMTTLKSIVQTDDNKIYALTDSNELICQDLEGATTIDFTFEQTSYQYNDSDINTYIEVWSKNSEDEYVETNVKLTLQGNAVWQSNGLQTLTVTTSDEGKLTVPFVIKGQSTINVSVDVVL